MLSDSGFDQHLCIVMVFQANNGVALGFVYSCKYYFDQRYEHTPLVLAVIASYLLTLFGCSYVKYQNNKWDLENGTSLLEKGKRDLRIGFGGITVIGIASQIIVALFNNSWSIIVYTNFVNSFSSFIFLCFFIIPHCEICCLKSAKINTYSCKSIAFHVLCVISSFFFPAVDVDPRLRCLIQVSITFNTLSFMTNYQVVLEGGVDLCRSHKRKVLKVPEIEPESENEEEEIALRFKELECGICTLQYSEKSVSRTPRILTECGHTICHRCAKKLLKLDGNFGNVQCPNCRKRTYLFEGNLTRLQKNWMMIGLIQEIKATNCKDNKLK